MNIRILSLAIATVLLAACSSPEKEPAEQTENKHCMYTYDNGSSTVEWTAFKFTEKTPVTGTFRTVQVTDGGAGEDPETVIKSLSFAIPVASVETQNPERNGKIVQHFFGTVHTDTITGKVRTLRNGKATIQLTMNGITKPVTGSYTLENNTFAFKATIAVANWNALPGIQALNAICKDLHTGADGVSKLWPDVEIAFTTTLRSDCQ